MIGSHELNMPIAVEAADDAVAPVAADLESLATLADMDVLAGFAMNAAENVAIQTAPLDPAFATVDSSEPAEVDAPDICEATAVAMPMSEPVTMCALPLPIEIEAASALDGEATDSGIETEIASATVSTGPVQAMAFVTDRSTALSKTLGEAPANPSASYFAGSPIADMGQVSDDRGEVYEPPALCSVAKLVPIEPASLPDSEAETLADVEVATELANMPNAPCTDSSDTNTAAPATAKTDATETIECDAPAVPHFERAVSVVADEGGVTPPHVPATLAYESEVQPAARVSQSPAEMDTIDMDEDAELHATDANGEIAATAPTPIATDQWQAEGAAHVPSQQEGTSNTMTHAPVAQSAAPPSVDLLKPDANPLPLSTAEQFAVPAMQVPMENPAYAMAQKFAERGIGVFPLYGFKGKDCACSHPVGSAECSPGKHPRQLATFNGSTTNSATITSWFTYFGPVNYGVATGKQVGSTGKMLVVVDIDWYKQEAQQTVEDLNLAGYVFPDTAEVLTGGGGRHLYYFAEIGAKFAGTLGAGIDFKGIGGYVVGPGSMHKSGSLYGWEASSDLFDGQEIANLPQWVYEKFGKPDRTSVSRTAKVTALPYLNDVSDAEIAEYKADLELISPMEYTTWCEGLMALKNRRDSEQMFGLADWWSQKAGYKDVETVRKKWNSIDAEGGITIKSLKRLADAERYKDVNIDLIMSQQARPLEEPTAMVWPEPEQIASCVLSMEYPLEALPGIMRQAVKEVQDYAMAPVALVACSALASLSVAAQGLYDVQRDVGLTGPIALYMIAIAESGERKSTLDSFFTKPIRDFEAACGVAAKPEILKFNTDTQAWEAKNKGILDKINQLAREAKDTSVQEAALFAHHATRPVAPIIPRIVYGDATPEALTRGLAAEWPSGGVISSEGGAVFGGHAMGKESQMRNMAVLNELWDGKPIRIDRRASESYTAKGTRLTVAVQVQPATLSAFMDGSGPLARGSGYIARFLIAYPESTQGTRAYKKAPAHWPMLDRFRDRIAEILSIMPTIEDGALKPAMLYLSDEAMAAWIDFYNEIEIQLGNGGGLRNVRDVASKTADNAARIAGLFHVLAGDVGSISEANMRNGTQVAMWHLKESQRVFAGGIASAGHSDARKLEDWMVGYCEDHGVAEVSMQTISQRGPAALRKKSAYM